MERVCSQWLREGTLTPSTDPHEDLCSVIEPVSSQWIREWTLTPVWVGVLIMGVRKLDVLVQHCLAGFRSGVGGARACCVCANV